MSYLHVQPHPKSLRTPGPPQAAAYNKKEKEKYMIYKNFNMPNNMLQLYMAPPAMSGGCHVGGGGGEDLRDAAVLPVLPVR